MGERTAIYRWALCVALAASFSFASPSSLFSQTLDPRKDPINILKSLDSCKTEALINGQQTAQLLLGTLVRPYYVELGRARVSKESVVDYCIATARYTETFQPGGEPQDWEIAGPKLRKLIADFERTYNSTKFTFLGHDAVLYSTGKSQTIISLFRGGSTREIDLRIGIASNLISIHDFDEKSECRIDGLATISFKKIMSYTGSVAEPGSLSGAICAHSPTRCSIELFPLLNRGETYKSMLFPGGKGYFGELKARFLYPLSYEIKAADGIFVLNEPWSGAKVQWLADSSSSSLSLFANGKKVASGICKFE
ncbi:hypothetical protein NKH69_30370 [Mesorhizobium sp. M0976]|uniref:hypothetical protein n=1 Tax=Mesorhizobium sp. M0976 TaxID=2957038 RepID=UPI003337029C